MRSMRKPLAALAACLLPAAAAPAHDTWILASLRGGERPVLRVEMTSGMAFPAPESGIRAERVTRAMVRAAGEARALPAPLPRKQSLRYEVAPPPFGLAVLWVELAPRALVLEPKLIEEYLREIGATQTVGPRWRSRPEPKTWREVYRKHAKSFLRVGAAPADDVSWREPVGMELELVPQSDPTALAEGGELSLVLLRDGRPLAGLPVAAERGTGAARQRRFAASDAAGRVSFQLDRPGPWLFAATDLRERGPDWESDFTTLTVTVGSAAR
jgi:uncharacterized GH25 family protein